MTSVNGTLKGGHIVTASLTVASKKNINDDFSPALTDYPSDPADIEAEYSRSRADERVRFVTSAILRLPMRFMVAPIFEYGSGQPWNARLGYDFNADGKAGDRATGVPKFSQDGPSFANVNLRITHRLPLGGGRGIDLVARDVQSVQPQERRRELDSDRAVPERADAGQRARCPSWRIRATAVPPRRCRRSRRSSVSESAFDAEG